MLTCKYTRFHDRSSILQRKYFIYIQQIQKHLAIWQHMNMQALKDQLSISTLKIHCFIGLDMTYRILYWQETNFEICSIANHSGNGLPGIKFFTQCSSVAREHGGSPLIVTTEKSLARNPKPYVSPVKNDMDLLTKTLLSDSARNPVAVSYRKAIASTITARNCCCPRDILTALKLSLWASASDTNHQQSLGVCYKEGRTTCPLQGEVGQSSSIQYLAVIRCLESILNGLYYLIVP